MKNNEPRSSKQTSGGPKAFAERLHRIAVAAPDAHRTAANMMRPLSRVRADKKAGNDFSR